MWRNRLFWMNDRLRSSQIKRSFQEIDQIMSNPASQESLQIKKANLQAMLEHAVSTTRFYKQLSGFKGILDFPVIEKNRIRENIPDFTSDLHDIRKLKRVSTSGSTGAPFSLYHCKAKRTRNAADNLFFSGFGNYRPGDPLYFLRVWNEINRKSPLSNFISNTHPVDVSDLSDLFLEKIYKRMNRWQKGAVILGYGSFFEVFAGYLQTNRLPVSARPKAILVMSDPLHAVTRAFLSDLFKCPVLARYSNTENGFLGHQWTMDSMEYLMNTASFHIEFLQMDEDHPVETGQPGRIVVTDLFNYAIPMIRYDTGDIGTPGEAVIDHEIHPVFKAIEGRKMDFIRSTSGELLSPHAIEYAVRNTLDLLQFQVIQVGEKEYTVKLIVRKRNGEQEKTVLRNMKGRLGGDAMINIEFVEDIPLLPSGKRKIVVNALNE
jgi:phenylacetate-CoA ligase